VSCLAAWIFTDTGGAQAAATRLGRAATPAKQVQDAALVTWPRQQPRPTTRQLHDLGTEELEETFWGLLFGLLYFVQPFTLAVGTALGATEASMADVGIADYFVESARSDVQPGTSALFVLTTHDDLVWLDDLLGGSARHRIATDIDRDAETRLREHFSDA
jgi:uncharacterized membrane protein